MTNRDVEVAVLGPLRIDGLAHAFRRAASRELVVYLALHREGARSATWGDALWPARAVSPATLHSAVSDARRALGTRPDGMERLPRGGRLLRLDDSVGTDVEHFALMASRPDPSAWMEALALVRGVFLDGLALIDWSLFDGTAAQVESMVTTTALKGAARCLAEGDGSGAEWMVRQALRVSPYDERLYRALLRAADVQGNRARLRSTMAELRSLAAAPDHGPPPAEPVEERSSWCHPRTIALYRELARGSTPAAKG